MFARSLRGFFFCKWQACDLPPFRNIKAEEGHRLFLFAQCGPASPTALTHIVSHYRKTLCCTSKIRSIENPVTLSLGSKIHIAAPPSYTAGGHTQIDIFTKKIIDWSNICSKICSHPYCLFSNKLCNTPELCKKLIARDFFCGHVGLPVHLTSIILVIKQFHKL